MKDTLHLLIIINISLYILHELDSIKKGEWKIFIGSKPIKDEKAYMLFALLHIPIILIIALYIESDYTYYLVSTYVIIHFITHLMDKKAWQGLKNNIYSIILIIGNAVTGIFNMVIDNI